MSKGVIKIGKPYLQDIPEDRVRLCSDILINEETKTLYYEVDKKYKEGLCYTRSDAFLVGLLHTAMFENMDIVCEDVVSERLLFQLTSFYIPIISSHMGDLNSVSVTAPTITERINCQNGVMTGVSGGVDSFYTLLKYSKKNKGEHGLTHAIYNNIVSEDVDEERIRKQHDKDIEEKKKISDELGIDFLDLYTNLYAFYRKPGVFNHYYALQYCSAALALAKLIGVYYFSSSYTLDCFTLKSNEKFDIFALECISTDTLTAYSAGIEVNRYEKTEFIIDNPIVQKHLQVCGSQYDFGGPKKIKTLNCGYCSKCARTIIPIDLLGQIDKYENTFDLSMFKKNKDKYIGRYLAGDKGAFSIEVFDELKKRKKYTFKIKIWRLLYSIRYRLAKNEALVKLVHRIKKQGD